MTAAQAIRPRFKAVLFDLDDTLFDHQWHRREALRAVHSAAGLPSNVTVPQLENSHEAHLQRTHTLWLAGAMTIEEARAERLTATLRDAGIDPSDGDVRRLEGVYRAAYDTERRMVQGAEALLDALKAAGLWIGIITNGGSAEQRAKIAGLGLRRWVDGIFISAEMGCEKPSAEFFGQALRAAGVQPGECMVVGDLWQTDIEGALAAGCEAIWLNRYGRTCGPHTRVMEVVGLEPLGGLLAHLGASQA